jgi:hypothetical protein
MIPGVKPGFVACLFIESKYVADVEGEHEQDMFKILLI